MEYIEKIKLDFNAELIPKPIPAKQLDNKSRYLLVEPCADKNKIDVRSCEAWFYAQRPDGSILKNAAEITEDGNIIILLTSQTLALSGIVRCEIKLYQNLSVLSSSPFYINVIGSISDNEIKKSNEYAALARLID